jgi:hypothetical protein
MSELNPKTQMDIADFWEKYRKEHDIGKNIVLMVIDTNVSLNWNLRRLVDILIDEIIRQREFEGKPAIEPEGGKG